MRAGVGVNSRGTLLFPFVCVVVVFPFVLAYIMLGASWTRLRFIDHSFIRHVLSLR